MPPASVPALSAGALVPVSVTWVKTSGHLTRSLKGLLTWNKKAIFLKAKFRQHYIIRHL